MFTEAEVRFLSREHAALGLKQFPDVRPETLRNRSYSERVIQRVLEERARRLGPLFAEFQNKGAAPTPTTDLQAEIAAEKLW